MLYRYCPHCGVDIRFLPTSEPSPAHLTPREQEVTALVMRGWSNKEIAAALGLAEKTIKHQVYTIMQKHNAVSRTQLAVDLLRQGWTPERLLARTPDAVQRRPRHRRPNRPAQTLRMRRVA